MEENLFRIFCGGQLAVCPVRYTLLAVCACVSARVCLRQYETPV